MAIKKYCKSCEIEIKDVFGFSNGINLKSGMYCKECGEQLREENMKKSGLKFH